MHKRYRVFIGSAFDLRKERSLVIQTLIEMDCIPEGMQLFPLREEKEFEHIKNIIDSSDCYLMVLGDRLGSGGEEKMIYVKKEYEYALQKGLDVLVLMHHDLDTVFRSGQSPVMRDLYSSIHSDSALEYWRDSDDLQKNLLSGFSKTIRTRSLSSPASVSETYSKEVSLQKSSADDKAIAGAKQTHTSLLMKIMERISMKMPLQRLLARHKLVILEHHAPPIKPEFYVKEASGKDEENRLADDVGTLIALAQSSFSRAAEQAVRENDAYEIETHGAVRGKLVIRQPGNKYSCDVS